MTSIVALLFQTALPQGGPPPGGGGLVVPAWAMFAVVGALASAIGVLFKLLSNARSRIEELQELRLAEAREYERALSTLRDKLKEKMGGTP